MVAVSGGKDSYGFGPFVRAKVRSRFLSISRLSISTKANPVMMVHLLRIGLGRLAHHLKSSVISIRLSWMTKPGGTYCARVRACDEVFYDTAEVWDAIRSLWPSPR